MVVATEIRRWLGRMSLVIYELFVFARLRNDPAVN